MSHKLCLTSSVFMTASILLSSTALALDPPDLRATTISGPGQAFAGSNLLATVVIDNIGGPLIGNYTAHVVLSEDLTIDGSDPIVATLNDSFLGAQSVDCALPQDLDDVKHIWGIRIEPAAGEVEVGNNWNVGPFCDVVNVDLELAEPGPIQAFVRTSDESMDPIAVGVMNVGTPESIVVFSTSMLAPVPWLEIDAPNSFAVGGQPANDIFLNVHHAGLVPGDYQTTLRIQNIYHPADFEDVEFQLTVGPSFFRPGDKIFGQIGTTADVDELEFDAVAGQRLVLKVKNDDGSLNARISVLDEKGNVEASKVFKHSKDLLKKILKVKTSGRKLMRIESKKGAGSYSIQSSRIMPKKAMPRTIKLKGLAEGSTFETKALLLPGSKLDFSVDPKNGFSGALAVGLEGPTGASFDLSGATTFLSGALAVEGIEADGECGAFEVAVGGFGGGKKEIVKLRIRPWHPQQGKGKVYVD